MTLLDTRNAIHLAKGDRRFAALAHLREGASSTRVWLASVGILSLLILSVAGRPSLSERVAAVALLALAVATVAGWLELVSTRRSEMPSLLSQRTEASDKIAVRSLLIGLAAALVTQTWFHAGTVIASGDIAPPAGAVWLSRLFQSLSWSGSDFGTTSQLPLQLPWAAVLWTVHVLGGSGELAQRIWYTVLVACAAGAMFGVLSVLRFSAVAALVGAVVFVFNAYVVSVVNIYPNYLAAMALIPILSFLVLASATGRLSPVSASIAIGLAAPVVGYIYQNPPLAGLVLFITVCSPLIALVTFGRAEAWRAARVLAVGFLLMAGLSAYWLVPAILQAENANTSLASLSTWVWTESRATVANAFWLNTFWGWRFPEYFPYAAGYEGFPFSALRFALPVFAFASLLVVGASSRRNSGYRLGLTVLLSTAAIFTLLLSTGTSPPGSVIFSPLYALPLGWLLREPGRFLLLVGFSYAIMASALAEWSVSAIVSRLRIGWPPGLRFVPPIAMAVAVIAAGFPLVTGAVVPDSRPVLPSAHVRVPAYWNEMANYVDGRPESGGIIVLPPDDFYQMPYTWGYYGTDTFVSDLFNRAVVLPNRQGYSQTSEQLVRAVNLAASSIINKDEQLAIPLLQILGTRFVLVREDIDTSFPGRNIMQPSAFSRSLQSLSHFALIHRSGPLNLYLLRDGMAPAIQEMPTFATVDATLPDLRLLSVLPSHTALITASPSPGHALVEEAPPIEDWLQTDAELTWMVGRPSGWSYRVASFNGASRDVVQLRGQAASSGVLADSVDPPEASGMGQSVRLSVQGRRIIDNGNFLNGLWGSVEDCNNVTGPSAVNGLSATIVPSAAALSHAATMRLSAALDSACEHQWLDWNKGPVLVSLIARNRQGAPPRLCLWELGAGRCAQLPSIPAGNGWVSYRATVSPDAGTTGLGIFLYADASEAGVPTVDEYANIDVIELPSLPTVAIVGAPLKESKPTSQVAVLHASYSSDWIGPINSRHVLVDGLLNGWLISSSSGPVQVSYGPAPLVAASRWISVGTAVCVAAGSIALAIIRRLTRRRVKNAPRFGRSLTS